VQEGKQISGGKQGRSACPAKGKSASSSNAASKDKGRKDNVASRKQKQPGKKNPKALTHKDLGDLGNKLEAKRPMKNWGSSTWRSITKRTMALFKKFLIVVTMSFAI